MKTRAFVLLSIVCALAIETRATTFYSIETSRDELVLVDTRDGSVQLLGEIAADMRDPDLAVVGDVIYVVNSLFTDGVAEVFSLDTFGNIATRDTLNVAGVPVPHAEGLASIDGELWTSFHHASSAAVSSDALGRLFLDGLVTDVVSFTSVTSSADGDGLCRSPSGEALWLDVTPPAPDDRRLVDVSRPPGSTFDQHAAQDGYRPISDIEFNAATDSLWGVGANGFLYLIGYPSFALLDSVRYNPDYTLLGLALASTMLDVDDVTPVMDVSIHPNPASESVVIHVPDHGGEMTVSVYDVGGRTVWSDRSGTGLLRWDLRIGGSRRVAPGVYFLAVTSSRGSDPVIRRLTLAP